MAPSRALIFIFVAVALDMLAFGIVLPILPALIRDFVGGDARRAAELYGLFNTLWAFMQFLFMPLFGALSDRVGRRPVLLLSIFGLGLDFVLMALAPSLWWLLLGRLISGITAASVATATAYIADVTPPERRAASLGVVMAALGLGWVLGPAIGGPLSELSPRLPFWVAAAFSMANALYGLFVLPESLPPERRAPFDVARANPVGSLAMLAGRRELYGLATIKFLTDLSYASLPAVFVLFCGVRFGWRGTTVGLSLASIGVMIALVQVLLVGRAIRRLGERVVLPLALCAGAVGLASMALIRDPVLAFLCQPFLALSSAAQPTLQSLLTRRVGPTEQGRLQGALSSVQGVVGMVGPVLFTQTFAWAVRPGGVEVPGAPFLLAALLVLAALPLALRETGRENGPPSPSPATG